MILESCHLRPHECCDAPNLKSCNYLQFRQECGSLFACRPMWYLRIVFCFAVCGATLDPVAAAQANCENVQPLPGSAGYQRRLNAERCEGFYQQQVAGTLELLSLVNGTINYDLVSDKTLVVSAPSASRLGETQIFLSARALRPGLYYRMDAVIGPTEPFKWPLGAVLAPALLTADSIGVVGWINRDLGKYYIPLTVVPENVAASAARAPIMTLRSPLDIEVLKWRTRPETGGARLDWTVVGGPTPTGIRAGQPIRLDLGAQTGGPIVIEIAPKYVNVERAQTVQIRAIMP